MADTIPGRQTINVGVQNQATGSDDLYSAFTKVETNFENLFVNASPYLHFNGSTGILITNPNSNSVSITNTGVTKLTSGTGITLDNSNGNVTISVSGTLSGVVAGVTNVGIRSTTLSISGSPIISNGNIGIELPALTTGASFNPGTYVSPTLTVDQYGRIVEISNISSAGTVTKIAVSGGEGISISGSPIIDSGTINVINTGVTRLTAGQGISLSGSNGAVTISGVNPPASGISRIDFASNTLSIAGSPITSSGTVSIELPTNATFTKITSANIVSTGPISAVANISTTGNIVANGNVSGNNFTINGNLTVLGTTVTVNNETVNQSETITGNLTVSSNAVVTGNLAVSTNTTVTGNIGSNNISVSNNANVANLKVTSTANIGNIITTNGIFWANGAPYSPPAPNILMTSITANTAIATTIAVPLALDNLNYVGDVLVFNNIAIDTESAYSTSSGKYTPNVAGYYEFTASFSPTIVSLGTNASAVQDGTNYVIMLVKNGSTIVATGQQIGGMNLGVGGFAWSGFTQSSIDVMVQMNGSTDYVQVFLVATIKSGSFTNGNTMSNYFQAIWLRP